MLALRNIKRMLKKLRRVSPKMRKRKRNPTWIPLTMDVKKVIITADCCYSGKWGELLKDIDLIKITIYDK